MADGTAWTPNMDKLLRSWVRQIQKNSRAHTKLSKTYRVRYFILGGPAVLLGGVASGVSFTVLRQCTEAEIYCTVLRVIAPIFMIISTTLTSLMSFYNFGAKAKEHSQAAERYDALARIINITLAFDKQHRGTPTDIMMSIRNQYDHIVNSTPSLKSVVKVDEELPFVGTAEVGIPRNATDTTDSQHVDIDIESMGSNVIADVHMQEAIDHALRDSRHKGKGVPDALKYQLERFNTIGGTKSLSPQSTPNDQGAGVGRPV